jgi:hypothetical protein
LAPTTTTPPPPPPPTTYSGRGDDVIAISKAAGFAVVEFACPKCTGNTVLRSDGAEDLLVNTIGPYGGRRWIDIRSNSATTTLTVTATGAWTITVISGLEALFDAGKSGPVTGHGDDVFYMLATAKKAAITNHGRGNFAVHVISLNGTGVDLAVNTIGSYSGTVPFDSPAIVQVTSSGDWAIAPAPLI